MDEYIHKSNIARIILFNKLHKKSYLKGLKISELKELVETCYVTLSNLNHSFNKSKIIVPIDDSDNLWNDGSLVEDILLLSTTKFEPTFEGNKALKKKLEKRWCK